MVLEKYHFPEMTTFSSVIRYSLCLEEATQDFFKDAAERMPDKAEDLNGLAESHRKRYLLLEDTRQQKLNEMILEPVSGLDRDEFLPDVQVQDLSQIPAKAAALEDLGARFYDQVSKQTVELSREASKVYTRMAKENGKLKAKIEKL